MQDGKLDINHKGLLEVDCATKTVTRPKLAYRAVQSLTAIVDGNVTRPKDLMWIHDAQRDVTRADATRGANHLVFLWVNNVPPMGNTTFSANAEAVDVDLANVTFADPVVVDLFTGDVYAAPACGAGAERCDVPVYDGPVVLADKSTVPITPTKLM